MTEAFILASAVSLVAVGVANLAVAGLALRTMRRYVELAEARMERLREDQAHLAVFLSEERRYSEEERWREEREWGFDARREAGRRIDRLKRELLAPAAARAHREVGGGAVFPGRPFDEAQRMGGPPVEREAPAEDRGTRRKSSRPAGFPETARKPSGAAQGNKGPQRGVWHPHPDDDVNPGGASSEKGRATDGSPVEIFRRHYDKYLDNYEGYVKLAGRIRQMRDKAEAAPDSPAEHEWEERLRRANDGIRRTTARLDILEEYNPELATDDRISRRAGIARAHSEL